MVANLRQLPVRHLPSSLLHYYFLVYIFLGWMDFDENDDERLYENISLSP